MESNYNLGMPVKKTEIRKNTIRVSEDSKPAKSGVILTSSRLYDLAGKIIKEALYGADNFRAAVISHYVLNKNPKLKKQAIKCAKEILQSYTKEKVTAELAEEAINHLFKVHSALPFRSVDNAKFTFIDLFAGIGGFRLALQKLEGRCVFSSEWDKSSQRTYNLNFGEIPFGDITKEETKFWIPKKFDLLCGGFPCQPFSIAGVVKKESLGKKHGFEDEAQGNLFFHIAEIISKHRPKAFFLENVKNLISHDKGKTFEVIRKTLEDDLEYIFFYKVLDGKSYVPQHRQRTFMVGFDKRHFRKGVTFNFPIPPERRQVNLPDIIANRVDPKYTLSDKLWGYLKEYAKKHKEKGNGFGYGLIEPKNKQAYTRTISARYYKDGAEILVPQGSNNPRRLTPKECALLQGFPKEFMYDGVSDAQAYRQFGNSVVVPLIEAIGREIVKVISSSK
jgi:DNA (cytosine-5)-methyltransferase 1